MGSGDQIITGAERSRGKEDLRIRADDHEKHETVLVEEIEATAGPITVCVGADGAEVAADDDDAVVAAGQGAREEEAQSGKMRLRRVDSAPNRRDRSSPQ
jgi:hypothetical protein